MSYRKLHDGAVQITLTEAQYASLMLTLGFASGGVDAGFQRTASKLVNAINEGNPNWIPYEIPAPLTGSIAETPISEEERGDV